MIYSKYLIKEFDRFHPSDFPKIVDELETLQSMVASRQIVFHTDMLVAFLKNHSMKVEWLRDHPELAEMISTKRLAVSHLEALFESCSKNPVFQSQLENYIRVHCTD